MKKKFKILKDLFKDVYEVDVMHKKRTQTNVDARKMFADIMRKEGMTLYSIGVSLRKDHSTIIHYIKENEILCLIDSDYKKMYQDISTRFKKVISGHYTPMDREQLEDKIQALSTELRYLKNQLKALP